MISPDWEVIVKVNDTNVSFIPWDTASHQDYDTVRPLSYPGTNRFVFNIWFASH
jgi:GTPase SAR1 family protein